MSGEMIPFLSIVSTLYRSQEYISHFCDRCAAAAELIAEDYELILVNDGSPDASLSVAKEKYKTNSHIVIVDLARNFGHHQAMMAGLSYARGDHVFLIDSDLEEEPELLNVFWNEMIGRTCDVVYGVQAQRRGGMVDKLIGRTYYGLTRIITGLDIPHDLITARLMTRRYVDALLQFGEREMDISVLWLLAGFCQVPVQVVKHAHSPTTYTLARKISLFVNSVTSFSNRPLVAIFYFGVLVAAVSSLFAVYLVINQLFFNASAEGWTSLMVSIWLVAGLLISAMGVIGLYLSQIFTETKNRPRTIVREVIRDL